MTEVEDGLVEAVRRAVTPEPYRSIGGVLVDVWVDPDGSEHRFYSYPGRKVTPGADPS